MRTDADNVEDIYELSPLQQVMLFQTLYAPDSGVYFEQLSFDVRGPFNVPAFLQAWQKVIDRYSILRTSFYWDDLEKPLQVVHRRAALPVAEHDWRALSPAEQSGRFEEFLASERAGGFRLDEAPLMRVTCFRLAADVHRFLWSFHHLLLDGWSVQLIFRDLTAFYEALCRGKAAPLHAATPYADYIAWLQHQDPARAEAFWRRRLKGLTAPTKLNVRGSATPPGGVEERYEERHVYVPAETVADLQAFVRRHGLTLNTLVQGAWALLLSRYSGEEDVIFGAIVSGRPAALEHVETMVGLFINTLPVRVLAPSDARLLPWLKELQERQLEAREYEYSNLVQVQGWSEIPRGTQMYESVLVFENYPMGGSLQGDSGNEVRLLERTNLPLTLMVVPGAQLLVKLQYNLRDFDPPAVERLLGHFCKLLEGMASDPERRLSDVPMLTEADERRLLGEWGTNVRDYGLEGSVKSLFERQAAQRPEAPAFLYGDETITFGRLNERSNRLAHHLLSLGAGPEVVVGVCLERSPEVAAALLAILKCGAAYLPLDPAYPPGRLSLMLKGSGAQVLVTETRLVALLPEHDARTVLLDRDAGAVAGRPTHNPKRDVTGDNLAYVIYTSGSTGRPKGVAVEHWQVLNRLAWMWEAYPFAPGEVGCQKTPLSFVDSIWELLGHLLRGAPTVILPDEVVRDPARLVPELARHGVTRLWVVPSLLRMILDAYPDLQRRLPRLGFWVTSGEALPRELFCRFEERMPRAVLFNLYGASEVWDVTWYDTRRRNGPAEGVPIGRPLANLEVYVLDRRLRPVPVGVAGELFVGGVGLARGYLHEPSQTGERFVPHPYGREPGARLYRTGDLVCYLPSGDLEYLGRKDQQVKIRGHRVEPAEVESALEQHPRVRQAAATARAGDDGDHTLVAYAVFDGEPPPSHGELHDFLQSRLPEYMMPSAFVRLDRLPLTPSGKIDRRALPPPGQARLEPAPSSAVPRTAAEETLTKMYAEVLGRERVGIHDNFFRDLGGHSLLATQLVSRLREEFGVEVPLRRFFEAPTVARLAAEVSRLKEGSQARVPAISRVSRDRHRVKSPAGASNGGGGE